MLVLTNERNVERSTRQGNVPLEWNSRSAGTRTSRAVVMVKATYRCHILSSVNLFAETTRRLKTVLEFGQNDESGGL